MANTTNQFPATAEMNGLKGIHIGNGIYQLEEPLRINRREWTKNRDFADYAVAPNNYSEDLVYCDIVYFTNNNYTALSELVSKLNEDANSDEYGLLYNTYTNKEDVILGGGLLIEV